MKKTLFFALLLFLNCSLSYAFTTAIQGVVTTTAAAASCTLYHETTDTGSPSTLAISYDDAHTYVGMWTVDATSPCICKLSLSLKTSNGTPPDLHAKIYKSTPYSFSGAALGTSSTVLGSSLTSSLAYYDFTFSPCVTLTGATANRYIFAVSNTSDTYDGTNFNRTGYETSVVDGGYMEFGQANWNSAGTYQAGSNTINVRYKLYKQ